MRQVVRRIGFKFDALLEVDQIQHHLIGRIPEGDVGVERVQQRRFTGAGFAGDQRVLGDAAAQAHVLQTGGAHAADGDIEVGGGCSGTTRCAAVGVMLVNGTFDAGWHFLKRPWPTCAISEDVGHRLFRRRGVHDQGELLEDFILPDKLVVFADEVDAVGFDVFDQCAPEVEAFQAEIIAQDDRAV